MIQMTNHLIYYYPSKAGAPAAVGRSLFNSLKKSNVDLLVFPQNKKDILELEKDRKKTESFH